LPELITLDCSECGRLNNIPVLPKINSLNFDYCPNLYPYTIPLKFLAKNVDLCGLPENLISDAVMYNSLNLEYIESCLNSSDTNHSKREFLEKLISNNVLVKSAGKC
jgi:hypothetical protein